MSDDEKVWIARALEGDDEAFSQLVEVYQRPVFNVCYRMLGEPAEAEDAAQETFIRAYTRLDSYDPGRKFSSWLLAIASHYCIDRLRRKRFGLVSWDDLPPWRWLPDSDPQPEEVALRHEAQRQVQELLNELPPDYKAAVILRYWYEFSYEEIAEALDASLPAIKSRLFRARQMMAQAASQVEAMPAHNAHVFANGVEAL
ncbi:MAG: sigma-70 family RNA polymerase sigma factor [Anaerolineae bacterium]